MGVPSGGEVAVYDSPTKAINHRVAVSLSDYPALTGAFSDTFAAPLDKKVWSYTEFGGPPVVTGGSAYINLYGGGCREYFVTRPGCMPRSLTAAFTIEFEVAFPAADPVFDAVVTVGTINTGLGTSEDVLRIVQRGSLHVADGDNPGANPADVGKLWYDGVIGVANGPHANDLAAHVYQVIYDPVAAHPVTIKLDGTVIQGAGGTLSSSTDDIRPYYIQFGMLLPDEALTAGQQTTLANGGTWPTAITALPIIKVNYVTVTMSAYEMKTYPSWTTTNLGNTIDTAADGERYTENGLEWAKVPKAQIQQLHALVGRSLNQPNDTFDAKLISMLTSNPNTSPFIFDGNLLVKRTVVMDTRVGTPDNATWAAWRRNICAIIESKDYDPTLFTVTGRDRPSVKLDTFFARGYFDFPIDTSVQNGPEDGLQNGLELDAIFEDLADVADALYGDPLGETIALLRSIPQAPQSLGTGGGSLISVLQQWVDRMAQEMWREYEPSGDQQYGRLRTNLVTLYGAADYTFRGIGIANPNIVYPAGVRFLTQGRSPGQAYYRNDSPSAGNGGDPLNGATVPVLSVFPAFAYPPNDRVLQDSYALGKSAENVESVLELFDKGNTGHTGGVAMWRYRAENATRRSIEFSVNGHNWMQPTDLISVNDPNGSGIQSSEVWVIDNVDYTVAQGQLTARIQATSTDWLNAIRQTL